MEENNGCLVVVLYGGTIILSIISFVLAWNWISPNNFWGFIGVIILWGILSTVGRFLILGLVGLFCNK